MRLTFAPCFALLLAVVSSGCHGGGGSAGGAGAGALDGNWGIDARKTAAANGGQIDDRTRTTLEALTYTFKGFTSAEKSGSPELNDYDGYYYVSRGGKAGGEAGVFKHLGNVGGAGDAYDMFSGNPNVNDRVRPGGQLSIQGGVALWTPKFGDFAGMPLTLRRK